MDYVGHVIRPPSEARSLILQVTVGCSHNMCTFCGTYKDVEYHLKDLDTIWRDIDEAAGYGYRFTKAFLADGDVLILDTATILKIMHRLKKRIPSIERIGVYGNTKAILRKSPQELQELRDAGLGIVYQGVESGNEKVLRRIKKGALPKRIIETSRKIMDAGLKLSQTYLLGIGGTELSKEHAVDTGKMIGEISPTYASALTVMLLPNTELYQEQKEGRFLLPDKFGLLRELRDIVHEAKVHAPVFFASNHASNYLPIRATLPDDREEVLRMIDEIIAAGNEDALKPEFMRAL